MDTTGSEETETGPEAAPGPDVEVSALRTSEDRVVFTECDNTDGWIASDLTVDLER